MSFFLILACIKVSRVFSHDEYAGHARIISRWTGSSQFTNCHVSWVRQDISILFVSEETVRTNGNIQKALERALICRHVGPPIISDFPAGDCPHSTHLWVNDTSSTVIRSTKGLSSLQTCSFKCKLYFSSFSFFVFSLRQTTDWQTELPWAGSHSKCPQKLGMG